MDSPFLGLSYLLYCSHKLTYKVFDQIKDLPIQEYPETLLNALLSKETTDFVKKEQSRANELNIDIISYDNIMYPSYSKQFKAMPPVIYCKGMLPFIDRGAAIVGSRKASAYGIKETIQITKRLVQYGFVIISGLAYGIDTQAHRTCLQNHGQTYAVLGCGLDIDYPLQNKQLKTEISLNGIILSEFPLGTPPISYNFPVRNRIISGLSKFILVVEASSKSGSLITADYGLDQGKDVLAVPGNIDQLTSKGTNQLIKTGAVMLNDLDSLDEYLKSTFGSFLLEQKKEKSYFSTNTLENRIVSILKKGSLSLVELIERMDSPTNEVLQIISQLEMSGLIKEASGELVWL